MADTDTTTVHTAEVVRYDDPVIITERVAVAAFIASYTDPTRRSYTADLRIFAGWCHDHGVNLLNVKRPHLETFARWMEQEGRMPSTIGRRLSTLSSFYRWTSASPGVLLAAACRRLRSEQLPACAVF